MASEVGIPQRRPRIFIIGIRVDLGGREVLDQVVAHIQQLRGVMPMASISDFLLDPSIDTSPRIVMSGIVRVG